MAVIKLIQISAEHPAQYDAFVGPYRIGWLRMWRGIFSVEEATRQEIVYTSPITATTLTPETHEDLFNAGCRALLRAICKKEKEGVPLFRVVPRPKDYLP